jgi:hypothetical protein
MGGSVSVREWQRTRSHANAEDAVAELDQLVAAGEGEWIMKAPGTRGGRPSRRFVLGAATKPEQQDNANINEWGEL